MPRRQEPELQVAVHYALDGLRTWLDAELIANLLGNDYLAFCAYLGQLSHTHGGRV